MSFLTGHSGAGKSTFLKLIAMLERPSSGQIVVNGQPLHQLSTKAIPAFRATMGIMFQFPRLLNDRTVFANVALPLQLQAQPRAKIAKGVHEALDKVGLLHKADCFPLDLSGGEQQRVGLARSIVHKPALLLADEPTGNLDPVLSKEVMGIFEQLNEAGVSVLIATHDLALIASFKTSHCDASGGSFMLNHVNKTLALHRQAAHYQLGKPMGASFF